MTDDSEMAFSLASSICHLGKFDIVDIACSYVRWNESSPPDIGVTVRNALQIGILKKYFIVSYPGTNHNMLCRIVIYFIVNN